MINEYAMSKVYARKRRIPNQCICIVALLLEKRSREPLKVRPSFSNIMCNIGTRVVVTDLIEYTL